MEKTKAEEHEALQKIREILKGFDPEDSYIGKAFKGCVEQAEENLRSDWMMSYKDRYDRVSEQLHSANARLMDVTKQLNLGDDAIARLTDAKNQLSEEIDRLYGTLDYKDEVYKDLEGKLEEAQKQISDLKQTIIELKARLYDMITGKEVKA